MSRRFFFVQQAEQYPQLPLAHLKVLIYFGLAAAPRKRSLKLRSIIKYLYSTIN